MRRRAGEGTLGRVEAPSPRRGVSSGTGVRSTTDQSTALAYKVRREWGRLVVHFPPGSPGEEGGSRGAGPVGVELPEPQQPRLRDRYVEEVPGRPDTRRPLELLSLREPEEPHEQGVVGLQDLQRFSALREGVVAESTHERLVFLLRRQPAKQVRQVRARLRGRRASRRSKQVPRGGLTSSE